MTAGRGSNITEGTDMLSLRPVFACGALYQAGADLTIYGTTTEKGRVDVWIERNGKILGKGHATAKKGAFGVTVRTPAASFDPCTITVTCGEDSVTLTDILFGEVWLTAGQSNMEYYNNWVTGHEKAFAAAQGRTLRFFHQFPWDGNDYPLTEQPIRRGEWYSLDNEEVVKRISAIGFSFAVDLYDRLKAKDGVGVPVGIVNNNIGATSIYSWLPHHVFDDKPEILRLLRDINVDDDPKRWNSRDWMNRIQYTAQYNAMLCTITGIRVRGILWYQGENESGNDPSVRAYHTFWETYEKTYEKLFAADPDRFTILPVLLYNWTYEGNSGCHVGMLNSAFVRNALLDPKHLSFVPIDDLPGSWNVFGMDGNHPIHPARKFEVGRRCALLAMANTYGVGSQKQPATLSLCRRDGHRLLLTFQNVGTGLYTNAAMPRGLYVRGENTVYLPANAEVVSPDTLAVWCDEIEAPVHVAFAMQSMQSETGLFAGDYPVAPFATEDLLGSIIEQRDYYDIARESRWIFNKSADVNDCFPQPVWRPLQGSSVCRDKGEILTEPVSLHINGDECTGEFGVAVKSYRYHRLDFFNFTGMTFNAYMHRNATVTLALVYPSRTITLPMDTSEALSTGWRKAKVDWSGITLPNEEMLRFELRFTTPGIYRVANIEKVRLLPRGN